MQVNEHVGQVQQGARPPGIDRALDDTRETSATQAKRRAADESRRTGDRPATTTRMPRRYGAGF
ncbi:MAG: hypothetical protein ACRETY_00410 [Steroidobacteraceae bacterium]